MGTLIYEVSPAYGFSKGGPLLAGMTLPGALSFIYGPFVLIMFILYFRWPIRYTVITARLINFQANS